MGKLSTKEILNLYYDSVSGTSAAKTRCQVDNATLYAYELKIGKEFIDMNEEELLDLIREHCNKRGGEEISYLTAQGSFAQIASAYRAIFNFYIDNIEIIRNPMNNKMMRGREGLKALSKDKEPITWKMIEGIISKFYINMPTMPTERAEYMEMLLLLFYNGISTPEEVVAFKESMIDHRNRTIRLVGRTISLSNRCYTLLVKYHEMKELPSEKASFHLASWRGSYVKFPIRKSQITEFDKRPLPSVCNIINRIICHNINDQYNVKIGYRTLYLLGFYDFMVSSCGKERTDELILSFRDSKTTSELMSLARDYGININNVSQLRRYLSPFVKM